MPSGTFPAPYQVGVNTRAACAYLAATPTPTQKGLSQCLDPEGSSVPNPQPSSTVQGLPPTQAKPNSCKVPGKSER